MRNSTRRRSRPWSKADGAYYLELFHGSTIAFKDMALSILPHLMTVSAKKNHAEHDIVILTATSGDTGKAAMAGFADVPGTRIIVFYPKGGVSQVQELQMVTQKGNNTTVVAIHGNFDDAQTRSQEDLRGPGIREGGWRQWDISSPPPTPSTSAVWCRRSSTMCMHTRSFWRTARSQEGEQINVTVPTGNFGNILAAYFAKQMGLPIGQADLRFQ